VENVGRQFSDGDEAGTISRENIGHARMEPYLFVLLAGVAIGLIFGWLFKDKGPPKTGDKK
jgi:hypothetical protein